MRKRAIVKATVLCGGFLMLRPLFLFAQTSPDDFLGFKLGTDRKLAGYEQIKTYS